MSNKKEIILDVDGVLLDYEKAFEDYFNLSPISDIYRNFTDRFGIHDDQILKMVNDFSLEKEFSMLEPFDGAIEALNELKNKGHKISIISSCGDDPYVHELRKINLLNVFGDIFDNITLIGMRLCKSNFLEKYKNTNSIWIDDTYKHYKTGIKLGLNSIWRTTKYNKLDQKDLPKENIMCDWKDISSYINNSFSEKKSLKRSSFSKNGLTF